MSKTAKFALQCRACGIVPANGTYNPMQITGGGQALICDTCLAKHRRMMKAHADTIKAVQEYDATLKSLAATGLGIANPR